MTRVTSGFRIGGTAWCVSKEISSMNDIFEPLSDDELNWLDDFLLDRFDEDVNVEDKDEGVIDVSELDGLLTAVVSGPVMIPPSQWLPQIWGDFPPVFSDEQELQVVMSLFMRHMNGISTCLMEQPGDFEPMFEERIVDGKTYTIVDEWCEGYMRGVTLAAWRWDLESPDMKKLFAPINAFVGEQALITDKNFSREEINNLREAITPNVREIHAYWLAHRSEHAPVATVKRSEPKLGRNDPCACGSGKKFKKCCLH